jgi:phosphoribosyl 1,2-cyclic phosphodiesterase
VALKVCLLASGSKGNAVYLSAGRGGVLVDCGLSGVELVRRMEAAGLDPRRLAAMVLTHEHRDHAAGVGVLARRLRLPVAAAPATFARAKGLAKVRHLPVDPARPFELAGLSLTPFSVPHDAADPVGLVVQAGAARLGLCTDLGRATRLVAARLAGCQALILECNHDPGLLAAGPYQEWLKQRVRSSHGHLSNAEGAGLLARLHHAGLHEVVLAHLSEVNNTPALARAAAAAVLEELGSRAGLHLAAQDRPTPVIEL